MPGERQLPLRRGGVGLPLPGRGPRGARLRRASSPSGWRPRCRRRRSCGTWCGSGTGRPRARRSRSTRWPSPTRRRPGSPERGFPPRSADDLFIIYTGGTTGMPKGVMWRQEDLFFAGLGGGAPTGEPVKRPEELAERVAAGGAGLTFFPTPPLMHGTSTLTGVHRLQLRPAGGHPPQVRARGGAADDREGEGHQHVAGRRRDAAAADRRAERARCKGTDLSSMFSVSSSGAIMSDTVRAAVPGARPERPCC